MYVIASQITSLAIVYSTVYSSEDQWKHQSSASLALEWGIHRSGEFPAQMASNAEMFPFNDVIMETVNRIWYEWAGGSVIKLHASMPKHK